MYLSFIFTGCYPTIIPRKIKTDNLANDTSNIDIDSSMGASNINKKFQKSPISYGKLKDLPHTIWTLLTNPTYMMINIGEGADGFIISGMVTFVVGFSNRRHIIRFLLKK